MVALGFNFILCAIFFAYIHKVCATKHSKNDNKSTAEELGLKTADLKRQAIKILELRGFNITKNQMTIKPVPRWDDIQITDDLYQDIKNSFDTVQKILETVNDTERTTAPDFNLIPFAKWPMPIKFTTHHVYGEKIKKKIRSALQEIEDKSGCILFEEVDSSPDEPHLRFKEEEDLGDGVCADSPLGREADVNVINVATECPNTYGSVLHETLHSLGFTHTQQRPDIDQYIAIHWENMRQDPDIQSNFEPWKYALRNQGPFDYGSILMYSPTAFTESGRETLTPKRDVIKNRLLMGQREHLSEEDVNILKKTYCSGSSTGNSGGTKTEQKTNICKDRNKTCDYWHSRGYCNTSSRFFSFVSDLCPKKCDICQVQS